MITTNFTDVTPNQTRMDRICKAVTFILITSLAITCLVYALKAKGEISIDKEFDHSDWVYNSDTGHWELVRYFNDISVYSPLFNQYLGLSIGAGVLGSVALVSGIYQCVVSKEKRVHPRTITEVEALTLIGVREEINAAFFEKVRSILFRKSPNSPLSSTRQANLGPLARRGYFGDKPQRVAAFFDSTTTKNIPKKPQGYDQCRGQSGVPAEIVGKSNAYDEAIQTWTTAYLELFPNRNQE